MWNLQSAHFSKAPNSEHIGHVCIDELTSELLCHFDPYLLPLLNVLLRFDDQDGSRLKIPLSFSLIHHYPVSIHFSELSMRYRHPVILENTILCCQSCYLYGQTGFIGISSDCWFVVKRSFQGETL